MDGWLGGVCHRRNNTRRISPPPGKPTAASRCIPQCCDLHALGFGSAVEPFEFKVLMKRESIEEGVGLRLTMPAAGCYPYIRDFRPDAPVAGIGVRKWDTFVAVNGVDSRDAQMVQASLAASPLAVLTLWRGLRPHEDGVEQTPAELAAQLARLEQQIRYASTSAPSRLAVCEEDGPFLAKLVSHDFPGARAAAVDGLASLRLLTRHSEAVAGCLRDRDKSVRLATVRALSSLSAQALKEHFATALMEAMEDADSEVRDAAEAGSRVALGLSGAG